MGCVHENFPDRDSAEEEPMTPRLGFSGRLAELMSPAHFEALAL